MKYILCTIMALLLSCQQQDSDKVFSFASSGEFHPFSFMDKNGEMQGYDIDVGRELAKRMNLSAKPVKYKFPAIVEGVKNGRFDAAVASHTVTSEREKFVSFTIPYYYSGPQIFSRPDNVINKTDAIKETDIAVSKGSTYVDIAKKFTTKISVYDSDITALEALKNGRHQFVITDAITGAMAIKRGLKIIAGPKLGESRQAIAVAKENTILLNQLNKHLKEMILDGTLKNISFKYFGKDITQSSKTIRGE